MDSRYLASPNCLWSKKHVICLHGIWFWKWTWFKDYLKTRRDEDSMLQWNILISFPCLTKTSPKLLKHLSASLQCTPMSFPSLDLTHPCPLHTRKLQPSSALAEPGVCLPITLHGGGACLCCLFSRYSLFKATWGQRPSSTFLCSPALST